MQISKERTMNSKPQNHLWSLSRGHYKWKIQMKFLVCVTMKYEIHVIFIKFIRIY